MFFVPGTIAPARELPDVNGGGNDEDPMKIFMANLNLVVPVVAAILVIIVAVIVICVLRGKGHGSDKGNQAFLFSIVLTNRYDRASGEEQRRQRQHGREALFPMVARLAGRERGRPGRSNDRRHYCRDSGDLRRLV